MQAGTKDCAAKNSQPMDMLQFSALTDFCCDPPSQRIWLPLLASVLQYFRPCLVTVRATVLRDTAGFGGQEQSSRSSDLISLLPLLTKVHLPQRKSTLTMTNMADCSDLIKGAWDGKLTQVIFALAILELGARSLTHIGKSSVLLPRLRPAI